MEIKKYKRKDTVIVYKYTDTMCQKVGIAELTNPRYDLNKPWKMQDGIDHCVWEAILLESGRAVLLDQNFDVDGTDVEFLLCENADETIYTESVNIGTISGIAEIEKLAKIGILKDELIALSESIGVSLDVLLEVVKGLATRSSKN
jgi:hypothetical protein